MDLVDVDAWIPLTDASALARWRPGDAYVAGGTSLFSEPQPGVRRLLDLTALDWPPLVLHDDALEIGATCTLGTLAAAAGDPAPLLRLGGIRARPAVTFPGPWTFGPLVRCAVDALVASFKVWHDATVGGNVCLALPAGAMTSVLSALGTTVLLWSPDGTTRTTSVDALVTGVGTTSLAPGEVVRAFHVPAGALVAPTAFLRASLSARGRSAAVVVARRTDDGAVVSVTGATARPYVLAFDLAPTRAGWHEALEQAIPEDAWLGDVHGATDWRRQQTHALGAEALRTIEALR
ncbi:FAD binding domain-containing protein [Mumia sp. ZJ1417]|uniref:FAD binding domain-containing protein n=1 Tax=Mumia sp. ZJ1417 TaxID=2708082 RepID=UPI00141E09A7|nr:FAD binding domain-containing protein [Mumia sp. ZJ1417]QMW65770.1 FAD binding domain-containing protein [Mumia sp. ZJ1417]